MKKYRKRISLIIFLIGISLLLYPTIGNVINKYRQLKTIDKYAETIHITSNETKDKMYEEAVAYNEKVYTKQTNDTRYDLADEYENVLNLDGTGVMGYIEVPKANIKLPIYHGVADTVLQMGVGHVRESSLPVGTDNQNSLLLGHSGLPTSKIFTNLEKLEVGDYFIITVMNHKLYYKIYETEVIKPDELIDRLPVQEGRDLVTLVTCTPYGVNSHRLVLHAERCEEIVEEEDNVTSNSYLRMVIICVSGILLFAALIIYLLMKKYRNPVVIPDETSKKKTTKKTTTKKKSTTKKKTPAKKNSSKKTTTKRSGNTKTTTKKTTTKNAATTDSVKDSTKTTIKNTTKKKKSNNQKKKKKKKQRKNNSKKK